MSNGAPKKPDYVYHFPKESLLKDVKGKEYKLPPHHIKSLEEIEAKLKAGNLSKKEISGYSEYLDTLANEIKEILAKEKAVGLNNPDLEKELRRIAGFMNHLASLK